VRLRIRYLFAVAAVAAILGAPTAVAGPDETCNTGASDTECSSPGNVQINDSPPAQDGASYLDGFYPGPYPVPWDEGGR